MVDVQRWYTSAQFQKSALHLLIVLALGQGVVAIWFRDGDFEWHRNYGQQFLERQEKRDHYPPARGFMDVPLALTPYVVARAISYVLCIAALVLCWQTWSKLGHREFTVTPSIAFAAGVFAVGIMLPFLLRDLDECGLQIFLLTLLTLGGWALARGRSWQAGLFLATAASYKAVPIIVLPFLVWKRQWRAAGWMVAFLALWSAAPALYNGWDYNVQAHQRWIAESRRLKEAKQAYPSLLDREPQLIYNVSLYALIARNLETYPAGLSPPHSLYVDHPLFFQFGNLEPAAAYYVMHGILGVIALAFLWRTRLRPSLSASKGQSRALRWRSGSDLPAEWAAVCAFCTLVSPLCWKQHLIVLLPCAFLVWRRVLSEATPLRWHWAVLGVVTFISLAGRRSIVGDFSDVMLSYKFDTLAMLTLLVWTLTPHGNEQAQG